MIGELHATSYTLHAERAEARREEPRRQGDTEGHGEKVWPADGADKRGREKNIEQGTRNEE